MAVPQDRSSKKKKKVTQKKLLAIHHWTKKRLALLLSIQSIKSLPPRRIKTSSDNCQSNYLQIYFFVVAKKVESTKENKHSKPLISPPPQRHLWTQEKMSHVILRSCVCPFRGFWGWFGWRWPGATGGEARSCLGDMALEELKLCDCNHENLSEEEGDEKVNWRSQFDCKNNQKEDRTENECRANDPSNNNNIFLCPRHRSTLCCGQNCDGVVKKNQW